jgi:hypothetical protein
MCSVWSELGRAETDTYPAWESVNEWSVADATMASVEDQLRAGHPVVRSLSLALADWSAELRMIETEQEKPPALNPAA